LSLDEVLSANAQDPMIADQQPQFLATKILPPRRPGALIDRLRLSGSIDRLQEKQVTVIKAGGWRALTLGKTVALSASEGRRIDARISEIRPLGEFATWRTARAVGDHDLNGFQLRFDPLAAQDGLRPSMTVWLP
jgi:hypothetical protein